MLPVELTSFVGRKREFAEVKSLLGAARLVTLTGVGGVGKTRLALRVARDVQRAFRDGVHLVELAEVRDPALVPQVIAEVLDIRDEAAQSSIDVLARHLEGRHLLLLLDSCEHLLDACARFVTAVLSCAPDLRIIVTSRQALRTSGEHVYAVPPLGVPADDRAAPGGHDAVCLLVDRARAVSPGFTVTEENGDAAAQLCGQLDGLPLAIELAAARLTVLSLPELVDRLSDRFKLLTTGSRAVAPRQQTLRDLIDWSYDLCSAPERLLWARLSAFSGSFRLDAVEAVCADATLPREQILTTLAGLIDKSVAICEQKGGRTLYRLLESIRQYGADRLDSDRQRQAVQERHLRWYASVVEHLDRDWFSERQMSWLEQVQMEHANVRAALEFCAGHARFAADGQLMAARLRTYWMSAGFLAEGRHWLTVLRDVDDRPTAARGHSLLVDGWLAILQGRGEEARPLVRAAADLAHSTGDRSLRAYAIYLAGKLDLFGVCAADAGRRFEESLSLFRELGDPSGTVLSLIQAALVDDLLGHLDHADRRCREALRLSEDAGERWMRSYSLWVHGIVRWKRGDHAAARTYEAESIAIKRSFGERFGVALSIEVLAWIAAGDAQYHRAATLFGALDRMTDSLGVTLSGFGHFITAHDEAMAASRRALGATDFRTAFTAGSELSFRESLAYALDEPPAPLTAAPDPDATTLTQRELQVADLVAQGMSNKEIAGTLVISLRTAETHVQHVLSKLSFTSRTQIATWFTEHHTTYAN